MDQVVFMLNYSFYGQNYIRHKGASNLQVFKTKIKYKELFDWVEGSIPGTGGNGVSDQSAMYLRASNVCGQFSTA